jgi:hypothetical protein
MKHTKGPWHVGRISKAYDAQIEVDSLAILAAPEQQQKNCGLKGVSAIVCVVSPASSESAEDMHNAKLIAAAPDLLVALMEFVATVEYVDPGVYADQIELARVAIRKATEEDDS